MLILHVREELHSAMLGQAELAAGRLPGGQPICVCFADLVGFTIAGRARAAETRRASDLPAFGLASSLGDESANAAGTARWVSASSSCTCGFRQRRREVSKMGSVADRSEADARRTGLLDRVSRVGRGRRAAAQAPADAQARRIEALEERVDQLEALLEGLQDAVYRESVRESGRIGALEKRTEPSEISRAVSRDARERGI
jgi:hypothetical protein